MSATSPRDDQYERVKEVLWGGPGGQGLVYAVDQLAQVSARHDRALFGANGKQGLVATVRTHERIVVRVEKALIWLLSIVATEAIGLVGYLLWVAIRSTP